MIEILQLPESPCILIKFSDVKPFIVEEEQTMTRETLIKRTMRDDR